MTEMKRKGAKIALEDLAADIAKRAKLSKLQHWTAFVETLNVPGDIYVAMSSMRPELIAVIQPRALDLESSRALFKIIAALIETNQALREHAEQLSQFVLNWQNSFDQAASIARKIELFANFDRAAEEEDERPIGTRASCATCGQDIEWHGSSDWLDRGGNRQCVPYEDRGEVVVPPRGSQHSPEDWSGQS